MKANKINLKLTKAQYTKINEYIDKVLAGKKPSTFTLLLMEPASKYSSRSGNLLVGYMQSENQKDTDWLNSLIDKMNRKINRSKKE